MSIAMVDYGVGNLFSLKCSFAAVGQDVQVTSEADELRSADALVLPGVGAFGDAMNALRTTGLDRVVRDIAAFGKPLLGICLGMQMLFDVSYEYGVHQGLGLIPGEVLPLKGAIDESMLVPQIGWNALRFPKGDGGPLFAGVQEGSCVYFVHSYYATKCDEHTIATTDYDISVTAAVQRDNVFGCQFHPEKSGSIGLGMLSAFCALAKEG